jgi:hypothetical protein
MAICYGINQIDNANSEIKNVAARRCNTLSALRKRNGARSTMASLSDTGPTGPGTEPVWVSSVDPKGKKTYKTTVLIEGRSYELLSREEDTAVRAKILQTFKDYIHEKESDFKYNEPQHVILEKTLHSVEQIVSAESSSSDFYESQEILPSQILTVKKISLLRKFFKPRFAQESTEESASRSTEKKSLQSEGSGPPLPSSLAASPVSSVSPTAVDTASSSSLANPIPIDATASGDDVQNLPLSAPDLRSRGEKSSPRFKPPIIQEPAEKHPLPAEAFSDKFAQMSLFPDTSLPTKGTARQQLQLFNVLRIDQNYRIPKNFRSFVQAMRSIGRRRVEHPDLGIARKADFEMSGRTYDQELEILKREARWLGITEAEYKFLLLKADPENKDLAQIGDYQQWDEQIRREAWIADQLNILSPAAQEPNREAVSQLCFQLQQGLALSKPKYFAQLFLLLQTAKRMGWDEEEKQIVLALQNTVSGLNSRRLHQFCLESTKLIQETSPEISMKDIFAATAIEIKPPVTGLPSIKTPQEEREIIKTWIAGDISCIQRILQDINPKTKDAFKSHPEFASLATTKIPELLASFPEGDISDVVGAFIEELKAVLETINTWQGQNPMYFHATEHWRELSSSEIGVTKGKFYSGAFVSRSGPLPGFGDVCFVFDENLETMARVVTPVADSTDVWFGFDRNIPINPTAEKLEERAEEIILDAIPLPQHLSPDEQRMIRVAMARWLENWALAKRTPSGMSYGFRSEGKDINTDISALLTKMVVDIQQGFRGVIDLQEWTPQDCFPKIYAQIEQEKTVLQQTSGSSSLPSLQERALVRAVAVRDEKCLFGKFLDDDFKDSNTRPPVNQEEVQRYLSSVKLTVPVLTWDMMTLFADYMQRFGTRIPFPLAQVGLSVAMEPINPEIAIL